MQGCDRQLLGSSHELMAMTFNSTGPGLLFAIQPRTILPLADPDNIIANNIDDPFANKAMVSF